jgi:hypothetical protein
MYNPQFNLIHRAVNRMIINIPINGRYAGRIMLANPRNISKRIIINIFKVGG